MNEGSIPGRRKSISTSRKDSQSLSFEQVQDVQDEKEKLQRMAHKLKVGKYRMNSEINDVKYVYVPSEILENADCFDDIFRALEIPQTPQLLFQVNRGKDVHTWNYKTPAHQSFLRLKPDEYESDNNGPNNINREHYEGVIRENCKRMVGSHSTFMK